jgi:hypothetical protein
MQYACGVVGVSGSVAYTYATTDNDNLATHDGAGEYRDLRDAQGLLWRYRLWFAAPGWNKYEAVCVVNNHYYGVKVAQNASPLALIKNMICPNTLSSGHYQCWGRDIGGNQVECHPSEFPVPLPGGCP